MPTVPPAPLQPLPFPPAELQFAAQQFGTPLYVYSAAELDAALARVQQAFAGAQIFYAMKANPNLNLLERFARAGVGFECVSLGELSRAQHLGLSGLRVLVNGPAKSDEEYRVGAELGATFILDRAGEIDLLPPRSRVLVRVNPALEISTHDHLATGAAGSKFGVTLAQAPQVITALRQAGHQALGFHVHIGSAIRDAQDFTAAFGRLSELKAQTGELEVLDTGGGWGLDADLGGIAAQARQAAAVFGAQLWVEPGRYLVARAGALLTRVVGTKHTGRHFCLVDAGMTELMRPMLYGAVHPVQVVPEARSEVPVEAQVANIGADYRANEVWDIAGPACESGDVLARDVPLAAPKRGDLLAFAEAGAYGASMSSNYLTRSRPAEVLYDPAAVAIGEGATGEGAAGRWQCIRRREKPADIWQAELPASEAEVTVTKVTGAEL